MRRIIFVFLLAAAFTGGPAFARTPERRLPEHETLVYAIKWIGLPVGTLTASIKGITKIDGTDVYVLEAVGKTNMIVSAIHKIDARFVSYMDVKKLYPLRFEVFRRDGRGGGNSITEFDQQRHKAHYKNLAKKTQKSFDIPERLQDILSACYYLMLAPFAPGDKIPYDVYYSGESRPLFAWVKSGASNRGPAFLIWPYASVKGGKIDKGPVSATYSCGERRIPLFAVVKGPIFGRATISLIHEKN